jgi:uncharacterized lipoprotein YmbA
VKPVAGVPRWWAVPGLSTVLLLAACAGTPDRFYLLDTEPAAVGAPPAAPTLHARLNVTIPTVVDRSEMVVDTAPNGMAILDHERWGAPLADQVSATLARDLERRRSDLLVGDGRFDMASSPPVMIRVDIVRMAVERGGQARLEAHWRIVDAPAAVDMIDAATFAVRLDGDGYAAVARAYSAALGELAERLAAAVPRR